MFALNEVAALCGMRPFASNIVISARRCAADDRSKPQLIGAVALWGANSMGARNCLLLLRPAVALCWAAVQDRGRGLRPQMGLATAVTKPRALPLALCSAVFLGLQMPAFH